MWLINKGLSSVLLRCSDRKDILPVKVWVLVCWGGGHYSNSRYSNNGLGLGLELRLGLVLRLRLGFGLG